MKRAFAGAVLVSFVFLGSAEARPLSDWTRVVKVVKSWIAKTLGDQMSDPKP